MSDSDSQIKELQKQMKALQAQVRDLQAFKKSFNQKGNNNNKQQQKKKKKKPKIDKSDVLFKVEKTGDAEDFKQIEADIRAIEIDGLMWASKFALADFVFGMKVLHVGLQIEDLMVPETKPVIDQIKEIKNVANCELVSIATAENDWGGKSSGKAPKGGKKKKNKKKGPTLQVTAVEIEKAIAKFATLARESEMYISGVPDMDRSGALDVTEAQLREVATGISAKKPDLSFVVIAAGKTSVSAVGVVPASWADRPGADAAALVKAGFDEEAKVDVTGDKSVAYASQVMDKTKDQFSIKEKEIVTSRLFKYYSSSGLCPDSDDESEDSMCDSDSD